MASYLPPTEELPIFDNQVFDIANNSYLTYTEAKKYFVSYPIAQGTATISDLITSEISYSTPASGSIFEIGTNQVSGGTIKVGPTGGTAGVSVHCSNLDFKNNGMNNATSNSGGDVSIGSLQTSGELNIGTGVRVTSGNGGAINIGNNATSAGPIRIGGTASTTTLGGIVNTGVGKISGGESLVGTSLPYTIPNTVNINSTIIINTATVTGTLTLPSNVSGRQITIRNITGYTHSISSSSGNIWTVNIASFGTSLSLPAYSAVVLIGDSGTWYQTGVTDILVTTQPITLPTTTTTPTPTQLGYSTSAQQSYTSCTSAGVNLALLSSIPIGKYIISIMHSSDTWSLSTINLALSTTIVNGSIDITMGSFGSSMATSGYVSGGYTGYLSITSTGSVQLKGTTSAGTVNVFSKMVLIKIA